MDRIWNSEQGYKRYQSLLSFSEVAKQLPPDDSENSLCPVGDFYGVYSKLYSQGRICKFCVHSKHGYGYILATKPDWNTDVEPTEKDFKDRFVPLPVSFQRLSVPLVRSLYDCDGEDGKVDSAVISFVGALGISIFNRFYEGIVEPPPKAKEEDEDDEEQPIADNQIVDSDDE
eukprot:TRINITY_DN11219_c0_g1_i1.p4 TRINITY_DN11219_c0_g1~~TRINITY_DN11219_c0_g1_i1.p4  ORF type:complete len:173 (-),score=24.16 TRINITY_DN11219_c0_g1_i1:509-1027(-)